MRGRVLRHARAIAFALAGLSFLGSLVVGNVFFARLSADNDEAVYVLEAQVLESGHLTLNSTSHGDAFRPWMSGRVKGDQLVLVEQPVLPALMAVTDRLFGSFRLALALIAAGAVLAVFAMTRQLLEHDTVALVAAGVFALSPFVIVQSALFVSYVLAVMLAALVIFFVDRGVERSQPRLFVVAGVVYGVLFVARPFDSILLAIAVAVWLLARRLPARSVLRTAGAIAIGAAPLFALTLAYNWATTGNPLRFPLWSIGGHDAFGFGDRLVAEGSPVVHYGPGEAFLALRTNVRALPHWILGGVVCLPIVAYGAWVLHRRERAVSWLLVAIAIVIPVGYVFYWGNYLIIGGRNEYGPHYYLALLIPVAVWFAVAVVDLASRRRVWIAVMVPLVLFGTAIELGDKIDRNRRVRDDADREAAMVAGVVQSPAVVVVPASVDGPYVLHPRGGFGNPPSLDAPVLYAADLQGRNDELFDRFPDRRIYRLQELDNDFGGAPDVRLLTRVSGDRADVTLDAARSVTDSYVYVDGMRVPCAGAHVDLQFRNAHIVSSGCNGLDVALREGATTVAVGIEADGATYEARYWVAVRGATTSIITPADIWRRAPGRDAFTILDPRLAPWLHTAATASG